VALADPEQAEGRRIRRQGSENKDIAHQLFVSPHTVDAHLKHMFTKLDIPSRVELTVLSTQHRTPLG
jgi:DNA-binding NarL/FixJ family response regulator